MQHVATTPQQQAAAGGTFSGVLRALAASERRAARSSRRDVGESGSATSLFLVEIQGWGVFVWHRQHAAGACSRKERQAAAAAAHLSGPSLKSEPSGERPSPPSSSTIFSIFSCPRRCVGGE